MPLLRMTTRRWMIAVAVVAVLLGGLVFLRRSRERLATAREIARAEESALLKIRNHERFVPFGKPSPNLVHLRNLLPRIRQDRERYERAALRPWLPVPLDPPEPE